MSGFNPNPAQQSSLPPDGRGDSHLLNPRVYNRAPSPWSPNTARKIAPVVPPKPKKEFGEDQELRATIQGASSIKNDPQLNQGQRSSPGYSDAHIYETIPSQYYSPLPHTSSVLEANGKVEAKIDPNPSTALPQVPPYRPGSVRSSLVTNSGPPIQMNSKPFVPVRPPIPPPLPQPSAQVGIHVARPARVENFYEAPYSGQGAPGNSGHGPIPPPPPLPPGYSILGSAGLAPSAPPPQDFGANNSHHHYSRITVGDYETLNDTTVDTTFDDDLPPPPPPPPPMPSTPPSKYSSMGDFADGPMGSPSFPPPPPPEELVIPPHPAVTAATKPASNGFLLNSVSGQAKARHGSGHHTYGPPPPAAPSPPPPPPPPKGNAFPVGFGTRQHEVKPADKMTTSSGPGGVPRTQQQSSSSTTTRITGYSQLLGPGAVVGAGTGSSGSGSGSGPGPRAPSSGVGPTASSVGVGSRAVPQTASGLATPAAFKNISVPMTTRATNGASSAAAPKPKKDEVDDLTDLLVQSMNSTSEPDTFGICHKCRQKVVGVGSGCTAMNNLYHVDCFTCLGCDKPLDGQQFYIVDAKPHCEECHLESLEKCSVCVKPITDRILRATGKPYHPKCFCCVVCGKCLDGIPFTVDAHNRIHCVEDFHKKFAPRCSVCKEPIMPEPGEEETVRVVALDRSFHVKCYRCEDCGLPLSSESEGRGCYPLDGHVLCKSCNAKRVQALTNPSVGRL